MVLLIMPHFTISTELVLNPYRAAFEQMAMGAVVVRNALSEHETTDFRERVRRREFTEYRLVHRGHFEFCDDIEAPTLAQGIVELAEFITESKLEVAQARCFRLTRGDYVLSSVHADEVSFGDRRRAVDVIVDLSEGSSGEAQVVYAHKGEHFFAAPQLSRSISVIDRRPSVTRYQRYLNYKMEDRTVYRHCVTLMRK